MNPTQHHFIHIPNILESAMSFGPSSRAANIAGACCRTLSCSAPHKMMAAFWDAQYMDWSSIPTLECCCSVTQLCPTLWDLTECNTPSFPILYYLSNFALTHVLWVSDAIQQSHSLSHPLSCPNQHQGLFPISQLFASGGQSIGASTSASVLPMNIQAWFLLGLTGLSSFLSK